MNLDQNLYEIIMYIYTPRRGMENVEVFQMMLMRLHLMLLWQVVPASIVWCKACAGIDANKKARYYLGCITIYFIWHFLCFIVPWLTLVSIIVELLHAICSEGLSVHYQIFCLIGNAKV